MPETDGVQEVLAFAAEVLPRSAEFWRLLPADQKVRFQDVIFPDGVVFDGQNFGTATMCYGSDFPNLSGFSRARFSAFG
jgi:hypothetical protein